jgi:hypothetical protein
MSACTRGSQSALFVGALLLSATVLSGCKGGGGGSSAASSNATTPVAANPATSSGKPTIEGVAPKSVPLNGTYAFRPSASDPDGDTLTFQIANKPSWATFNTVTGELTGKPTQTGTFADVAISATDGTYTASLAPFTIVVEPAGSTAVGSNAPSSGSGVSIAWTAPTERANGAPLTDLSGFLIAYGTSEQALTYSVYIDNPAVDRFVFQDLKPGKYYFAVRAVTAKGELGELSELKAKQIG